jgi:glycine cleavage system H lipoate-binding protein
MTALLSFVESIGIFLAGLVVRFGLFVGVLLVLTVVFLIGLGIVRLVASLRRSVLGLGTADGMSWKRNAYYAAGHTWLEPARNDALRVGFDDLGQKVLSHITALTLPVPGTRLKKGEALTQVACGDRQAVIPAPVGGTVVAINDAVIRNPELVHRDPYRRGWLVALKPDTTSYIRMPWGEAARNWLRQESGRLSRFMEQQLQLHAADGGELTAPGTTFLDEQQWREMVREFLKREQESVTQ